ASASPAPAATGTVRVAANPRYRASGLHRLLLGANYRQLWTTPVQVEVLDLHAFAGGLTPLKKGGGKQTKSLRFDAADGREFRVRSVDKDPEAALPVEYRDTFVLWVAQDQTSAAVPAGPLVAERLEQALGLLHVSHKMVVLPDDPALGEFRKEFAGMLGILEEQPRVKAPVTPGFEDVEKVYDWDDVWTRKLDLSPEHRVDSRAYLRARLLDMFIGDWDRHQRQFSWAAMRGKELLQPVPEDRDQAFAKFDGLVLALGRLAGQSRFVDFGGKYPPPEGLNWAARFMDRRILSDLDRTAWNEVVREVQEALTDSVIEEAVRRMPPEYFRLVGPKMVQALRVRRGRLPALAMQYYGMIAREAEVWGTERADFADVVKNADGTTEVRLSPVAEGGRPGPAYFHRVYRPEETSEIRLYLMGGDDRTVTHPGVHSPIRLRVIGDSGNDVVDDSQGGETHFYDDEGHNTAVKGPGTIQNDQPFVPVVDYLGDPLLDWGSTTGGVLWLGAETDVGVLLGLRLQKTAYGFRKYPYRYRQSIGAAYSTALSAWKAEYDGDFVETNSRRHTQLLLRASEVEIIRFHGFGNETVAPEVDEFYRSGQRQYLFQPRFHFGADHLDVWAGPTVKYSHTPVDANHFLTLARPYGVGDFGEAGAGAGLLWDTRNHGIAATHGAMVQAEGNYYPSLWSVHAGSFGEVHGVAAAFLSPRIPLQPTLALLAGGKQVWGIYPFHESAFLGGPATTTGGGSVRGLPIQRYAGDAAVWGNAELRVRLFGFNLLVPEDAGLFALADTGRVYLAGEDSHRWHTGVGGGFWISFLRRENTLSVAAAKSEGSTRVYVNLGFGF
ncbi:MAG TPA: hypothetical protein VGQ33_05780, partial [Vicinamibacteria bacterium]|nr:hypothetical protein [Vicinamibacteria bacterium]